MKIWQVLSGAALAVAISGCADESTKVPTPTLGSQVAGQSSTLRMPNVSGTAWIRQKVALPPNAVLTVTLSDASLADAPSKVVAQHVVRTEGAQAPFRFILPFNPADVKPHARILLSAAVTVEGKLLFVTDTVKQVVTNGETRQDLTLVPVPSVAIPTQSGAATAVPPTSPSQVSTSSSVPAATSI
ncbi:YbaY family lipoprotein [Erwinia tasmaniensis]|uniref:Probable glycoprotein involved in polysaccharide metabolism n=1 Tax=Erwinia tasmaniensis (strain DSM 17950 / CFBP 7177 / CIP 109463 / NCPPB 4357 / Et1/99) TaxID=465817 RepID=B2VIT5_ERWT9|nr:YbaY family lipoprotein [Erwinia tasmaniensis]CAO97537.1 Probable glycoprotein involved in polysaccharide metabolism [Erwinia tasmaniensis Et1/99]